MSFPNVFSFRFLTAAWISTYAALAVGAAPVPGEAVPADEGIRFTCQPAQFDKVRAELPAYLASLKIDPKWVVQRLDPAAGALVLTLNTPPDDVDTVSFSRRPEFGVQDEVLRLPDRRNRPVPVRTVSRREILLALLQHGRLTEFAGAHCSVEALRDHVAIRQNIVGWVQHLHWVWPDGEAAQWNRKYWRKGTPVAGFPLHLAIADIFRNQDRYSIGCYTAAKIVMIHGVLDYYQRIKRDRATLKKIEDRLSADGEPLVGVEPGEMWSFDRDSDPGEANRPGKLLDIRHGVAAGNFVPGDWVYMLNTDPISSRKTGYEGANAIYLGGNRFSDYYDDHNHSYTYEQKLDEVYQWRNGVFNRFRDAAKIVPLSAEARQRLTRTPAEGGLLLDLRVFPSLFGEGGRLDAMPGR